MRDSTQRVAAGVGWYGRNASISRKCKVVATYKNSHVNLGFWLQEVTPLCVYDSIVYYPLRWDRGVVVNEIVDKFFNSVFTTAF